MDKCESSNSSSASAASTACTNETEECEFDSNTTTDSSTTTIAVPIASLFHWLKYSERSSLAREHKMKTNPSPFGAKKANDTHSFVIHTRLSM